jgi:Concanavalin A-like lectin/glucanases superfamily
MDPSPGIVLSGVHAYAEKVITAGESIHFRVSSDVPYTITVARLGPDADGPSGDQELFPLRRVTRPRTQRLFPGSYVHVVTPLPDEPLAAVTLECWVRPFGEEQGRWQGLVSQHSFPSQCGIGLFLNPQKQVFLYLGTGRGFDGARSALSPEGLSPGRWHHVVGVWNGSAASLWIDGQLVVGPFHLEGPVQPGTAALRLAAYGQEGQTRNFLDGDLAMPVI